MKKVELTPEQEELAKKVSDQITELLNDNGLAISIEMIYGPDAITAKPIMVFKNIVAEEVAEEKND